MRKYKIFLTLLIVFGLVLASQQAFAQISTDSVQPKSKLTKVEQSLQDKITLEINRRLTSLTNLEKRVQEVKKLSESNKNNLVLQIQDQITSLNSIKSRIQGDIDLATLKDERLAMANQYRIYLLFIPKIHILATSDRIMEISSDMDSLLIKLQTRIDFAKQNGKDVTLMQATVDDIKTKIADANIQAKAAVDLVTPLVPDQGDQVKFTANKQALQDARKKLIAARQDLSSAKQGFDLIKQQLNPAPQTSTPSAVKAQ
ncbi:MAG: hypothetical protein WCV81_02505 [Microgenomates group bacterium]|jgi:hypothetical protein